MGILSRATGALFQSGDDDQAGSVNSDSQYTNPRHMMMAGLFMDAGRALSGMPTQNQGISMYLQAREANERQRRYEQQQARQAEIDAQPVQYTIGADGLYAVYRDGSVSKTDVPMAQPDRKMITAVDGHHYYADTGERVLPMVTAPQMSSGSTPAAIAEYRFYSGLSPDDQKTYLTVKRSQDKSLDRLQDEQNIKTMGKLQEQAAQQMGVANETMISLDSQLEPLTRARQMISSGMASTGTSADRFLPRFMQDPANQELISIINSSTLSESQKISGALSDRDMDFLQGATISLDNSPEANLEIIDRKIRLIDQGRDEMRRRYRHFYDGGTYIDYKPAWMMNEGGEAAGARTAENHAVQPTGAISRPTNLLNKYGVR